MKTPFGAVRLWRNAVTRTEPVEAGTLWGVEGAVVVKRARGSSVKSISFQKSNETQGETITFRVESVAQDDAVTDLCNDLAVFMR